MNFQGLIEMNVEISNVTCTEIMPMLSKPKEAILYFHGYSSSRQNSLFRARLLASMGYYVLVYEVKGHGDRSDELKIDMDYPDEKMWDIVISTITESPNIINYLIEKRNFHPHNIIFCGHSMGAMIASGIFIKVPVGKLVCFNGCLDFKSLFLDNKKELDITEKKEKELLEKLPYYSPYDNISRLENRPILLVDGENDTLVPCKYNEEAIKSLKPYYEDKTLLSHSIIDNAEHAITVTAFELMLNFLNRRSVKEYGKQN